MIQLAEKNKCCGCQACVNACKYGALTLENDETGFGFPSINREKCIKCGACIRACPALGVPEYRSNYPKAFIVQNKDDEIRRQSTSGGGFTGVAQQVLNKKGVVFGACIGKDFKVSHIWVENEKDLELFRNSKYVQSNIGFTYREAESFLKDGRYVCFSGTPCQIYGLKKYLGKEYVNLLTIDVMCRAVPSPKVLQKYLEFQKQRFPLYDRIVFRDKSRGYSYSGVTLYKQNKILYRGGSEFDPWLRLFLGGYCNREACHECLYQDGVRASDITLWDCWGTQKYEPKWDDNKGTTNVITWTAKGEQFINNDTSGLRIKEIGIENIDASLKRGPISKPSFDRGQFYLDCDLLSADEFIKKYVPITAKIKIKSILRNAMHFLHIHDYVRKMIHKMRKAKTKGRDG